MHARVACVANSPPRQDERLQHIVAERLFRIAIGPKLSPHTRAQTAGSTRKSTALTENEFDSVTESSGPSLALLVPSAYSFDSIPIADYLPCSSPRKNSSSTVG